MPQRLKILCSKINKNKWSNGDSDIENRLMDPVRGDEGEGGMYIESKMEAYITIG